MKTATTNNQKKSNNEVTHFFDHALRQCAPAKSKLVAHFDARLAWLLLSVAADPDTHPDMSGVFIEHSSDGVFMTAQSETMQACYADPSGYTAYPLKADFTARQAQIMGIKGGRPWGELLDARHQRNPRAAVFEYDKGHILVVAAPGALIQNSEAGLVRQGMEPLNSFRLRVNDADPLTFGVSRDDLNNMQDATDNANVFALTFNNGLFEALSEDRSFIGFMKPVERIGPAKK